MSQVPQLIGCSAAIRNVLEEVVCAARSDAKVLLTGESGVGKEIVANLIHAASRRSHASLIAINCAGVPDSLLASELFGHVRGSFTDAYRDKQGWLEQAHRGTIFMDEIGEMSLQMQALLLRFLESGEIQRIGSDRATSIVDVRIIAATNRRLLDRIAVSEFRSDLFYRLNVIHIEIPPLRERREDIPLLVEHFQQQFTDRYGVAPLRLSDDAMTQLITAPWPGNVRELRNVVERLVIRSHGRTVTAADLPREVLSMSVASISGASEKPLTTVTLDVLFERMVRNGETFWSVVYEPFMSRDLTRDDLRALVRQALAQTRGGYKSVAALFNVAADHKKLLTFLRRHECDLPDRELQPVAAHFSELSNPQRAVGD